ncbi:hypothetical protein PoB_003066500 [Plakobranchus ocellatus]|uniref:t-SNARE coiled-coil homology domain-containing protein n=1 Tax=Plakobranchus ocellatus TaxID=259542 RepID=A0AAV4A9U8_9GAST|nr:hypothetical protein PoB_003066500 [Plakobranchus ocellatus]
MKRAVNPCHHVSAMEIRMGKTDVAKGNQSRLVSTRGIETGREIDGLGREVDGLGREIDGLGREVDGLGRKIDGLGRKKPCGPVYFLARPFCLPTRKVGQMSTVSTP